MLRTRFQTCADGNLQHVLKGWSIEVAAADLSHLIIADARRIASDKVAQEPMRAFDLTQDALLRVNCIQLSSNETLLAIVLHHIVADGWSLEILVRKLGELYTGNRGFLSSTKARSCRFSMLIS